MTVNCDQKLLLLNTPQFILFYFYSRHNADAIFREDIENITPSPQDGRAGSTPYKPTTIAPPSDNNINEVYYPPDLVCAHTRSNARAQ